MKESSNPPRFSAAISRKSKFSTCSSIAFDEIVQLAKQCRFKDCTHTSESGCAVVAAVENGDIDPAALENFLKLEKEKEHYESTEAERKKKDKDFGKMLKNYKKGKYKDNY